MGDAKNLPQENVMPQAQKADVGALAQRVEHTPFDDLQWQDFYWEVVARGSCFCRRAYLRLFSDGLASFQGYTSTTSAGDVWLFQGIGLNNVYGNELYRISQFNGPRMDLPDYDYFVLRDRQTSPLVFPAQLYSIIKGVKMFASC